MNRYFTIAISIVLILASFNPLASANQKPIITSFTFTPNEIELTGKSTVVSFELIAEHPNGIDNQSIQLTLNDGAKSQLIILLNRTDTPVDMKRTKVTFKGNLDVPRNIVPGVYNFSTSAIRNGKSAGYDYEAEILVAPDIRTLTGAKKGLLVRKEGDLNLRFNSIIGPSYDVSISSGLSFLNPTKFKNSINPLWKADESINLADYFESQASALSMRAVSGSPSVCKVENLILSLLSPGICDFSVFTEKTLDYAKYSINQSISISAARIKPVLTVNQIATQDSTNLPKSIRLESVYSASEGYVFPNTLTPEVCLTSTDYVQIVSGGICRITYQTSANSNYKQSDLYTITFEITRKPQTIEFELPTSAINSENRILLFAKASNGAPVNFSAKPSSVCLTENNKLIILSKGSCEVTATQVGSKTISPATVSKVINVDVFKQKKGITCVKKKIEKKFNRTKCLKGWIKK